MNTQSVKQIPANQVGIGDIIDGPDGLSTVVNIERHDGLFRFDFAEGNGNRCWSGLRSNERVPLHQKSTEEYHGGFLVNTQGEVMMPGACIVKVADKVVTIIDVHGAEHRIKKSAVRHIIGQFALTLNPAD